VIVRRVYRFRLELAADQERAFGRLAGARRFVWNWLRHEVAPLAVGTSQGGPNPVCCHRSPTATCDESNLVVGRSRDNVALTRKGQDEAVRRNRDCQHQGGRGARSG